MSQQKTSPLWSGGRSFLALTKTRFVVFSNLLSFSNSVFNMALMSNISIAFYSKASDQLTSTTTYSGTTNRQDFQLYGRKVLQLMFLQRCDFSCRIATSSPGLIMAPPIREKGRSVLKRLFPDNSIIAVVFAHGLIFRNAGRRRNVRTPHAFNTNRFTCLFVFGYGHALTFPKAAAIDPQDTNTGRRPAFTSPPKGPASVKSPPRNNTSQGAPLRKGSNLQVGLSRVPSLSQCFS
jgi:hypothetical protein